MSFTNGWRAGSALLFFAALSAHGMAQAEQSTFLKGFYAGADLLHVEGNGVPARIRRANPGDVGTEDGHKDRIGYRLDFGHQWPDGGAVEGALLDLGDADLDLLPNGATANQLRQAGQGLHPQTARGLQLGIRRNFAITRDWRVSAGGGFWHWRSEWEFPIQGETEHFDDTGFGPALNLEAGWSVTDRAEVTLRWDRLDFAEGYVNAVGLGVGYRWSL